jgi:hypothetical protein
LETTPAKKASFDEDEEDGDDDGNDDGAEFPVLASFPRSSKTGSSQLPSSTVTLFSRFKRLTLSLAQEAASGDASTAKTRGGRVEGKEAEGEEEVEASSPSPSPLPRPPPLLTTSASSARPTAMAPLPVPKSAQGRLDRDGEEEEDESFSAFAISRNAAAARSTSCSVSGRGHSTPLPTAKVTRRQCAIPTTYWKGKRSFIRASQRTERSGREERRETTGDEAEEEALCSSLCSLAQGGEATASSRNQSSSFCN